MQLQKKDSIHGIVQQRRQSLFAEKTTICNYGIAVVVEEQKNPGKTNELKKFSKVSHLKTIFGEMRFGKVSFWQSVFRQIVVQPFYTCIYFLGKPT